MKHAINWFEIPVRDFARAQSFYQLLFNASLTPQEPDETGSTMAFLPADMEDGGIGGCIISGPEYEPSEAGALVYLNGGDNLSVPLSRVEQAGGKIVMPKTSIGEHGFMAQFIDTEGNKLAIHSIN
ncbi:VOC family protein [Tunicatimonas pelagia]|uniref:VOC family protein n=1 Tax=Tunicatimonas pelagia TaxID=931531 RepID=UPI0026662CE1|nr:VOC family protein [Tunicatimonas pelagia]WKN43080.1 VOC family protein [Tunicatimonas pelagia]